MLVDLNFVILLAIYAPLLLATFGLAVARWPISFAVFTLNACLIAAMLHGPLIASDDRLGLARLVASALVFGLVAMFVAGSMLLLFRAAKTPTSHHDEILALLAAVPAILMLLFGLGIFSRWRGDVVFALLTACAVLSLQQAIWRSRKESRPLSEDPYGIACMVVAATASASIALAGFTASVVLEKAQRSASGRPYCIQSGARTAGNILDLSLLTFREPRYQGQSGPNFLRNHGLLIVDSGVRYDMQNWSYRSQAFLPESLAEHPNPTTRPQVVCEPH
ncbi:hypothetical protein ASC75_18720 [Aminobacter sp. DSM 101952]|uniref:hypothetical protein n=1 Tax=Aminobacter sp. DSM 101952 TaxID=2735891 RepID=UPI0006F76CCC|nr:hypothetical protein [Aminobacter sp. DSM 101952]KQU75377.1 hypothetical protein ASC75_18720 [Aminobacter sp. DSM 101952]